MDEHVYGDPLLATFDERVQECRLDIGPIVAEIENLCIVEVVREIEDRPKGSIGVNRRR
jgi:hypothetical protein